MDNLSRSECLIGIINDYDNTSMVTLDGLKCHIKDRLELKEAFEKDALYKGYNHGIKGWTLADYCDRRKSTDLSRFEYCPHCGKKIDWKAMKVEPKKKGGAVTDVPIQLSIFDKEDNQ
jgi:hypothetical protein